MLGASRETKRKGILSLGIPAQLNVEDRKMSPADHCGLDLKCLTNSVLVASLGALI